MSSVLVLYRIQKIDSQLDLLKNRLVEIEKLLNEDQVLRQARLELSQAEEKLQTARRDLKQTEDAVQSQQIKIEETESSLYGGKIHNPKELQDLQHDVASLKRYLSDLENTQLEAMLALEQAEEQVKARQAELLDVQSQQATLQAANLGAKVTCLKEIERQEAERKAAISKVPQDDLQLYERLRQQKRGIAVVAVADGSCSACGSTLTPAEWQNARSPSQISFCPTCGRMLYAG